MKERNEIMRFFGLHPQNDAKRKFAFTLAEVLITLGIIGVVAALTIPNLIQEYQKKQWVAGLQRGYSTLNQVFKNAMAEDLVSDVTQTELYNAIPTDGYGGHQIFDPSLDYSLFTEQLKKYLKITKVCNPTDDPLNDPCYGISYVNLDGENLDNYFVQAHRLKVYTADGIVYYFYNLFDGGLTEFGGLLHGVIEIDVNGDAGPNQFGRDLFPVMLLKNGNVVFAGTKSWEMEGFYHWSDDTYRNPCLFGAVGADVAGTYCGARIFENGWKMDY